jgi:hypothetical protein
MEKFVANEVAWFTDDDGSVFGTITEGKSRKSWGYVILGRDASGEVLLLDRRSNYRSWQVAALQFVLAIDTARQRRLALVTDRRQGERPE